MVPRADDGTGGAQLVEVETLRENPFDFLFAGQEFGEPLTSALTPYLTVDASEAVAAFARRIGPRDTLAFLAELNRTIFDDFAHTIRDEGPAESPETTLALRSGTCRDLAVLYCAACRSLGIPARFVSGYEASQQERRDMHAWAEVYLRGGGWRGYDPSQGLAVTTSHVAVAAAADPRLAAPASGTYRGTAQARMEYRIEIAVGGRSGAFGLYASGWAGSSAPRLRYTLLHHEMHRSRTLCAFGGDGPAGRHEGAAV